MTTQIPDVTATRPPRRPTDAILATLAERIGGRFTASTVFGSPVERDGVTVIPAATVRLGLGAGSGDDPRQQKSGDGGGGGGEGVPAGYIEITAHGSRFVPVVHPTRIVALCCATAVAVALTLRPDRARHAIGRGHR